MIETRYSRNQSKAFRKSSAPQVFRLRNYETTVYSHYAILKAGSDTASDDVAVFRTEPGDDPRYLHMKTELMAELNDNSRKSVVDMRAYTHGNSDYLICLLDNMKMISFRVRYARGRDGNFYIDKSRSTNRIAVKATLFPVADDWVPDDHEPGLLVTPSDFDEEYLDNNDAEDYVDLTFFPRRATAVAAAADDNKSDELTIRFTGKSPAQFCCNGVIVDENAYEFSREIMHFSKSLPHIAAQLKTTVDRVDTRCKLRSPKVLRDWYNQYPQEFHELFIGLRSFRSTHLLRQMVITRFADFHGNRSDLLLCDMSPFMMAGSNISDKPLLLESMLMRYLLSRSGKQNRVYLTEPILIDDLGELRTDQEKFAWFKHAIRFHVLTIIPLVKRAEYASILVVWKHSSGRLVLLFSDIYEAPFRFSLLATADVIAFMKRIGVANPQDDKDSIAHKMIQCDGPRCTNNEQMYMVWKMELMLRDYDSVFGTDDEAKVTGYNIVSPEDSANQSDEDVTARTNEKKKEYTDILINQIIPNADYQMDVDVRGKMRSRFCQKR